MFARLAGFTPHHVARLPAAARRRLEGFGVASVAASFTVFLGLGELFRAMLGSVLVGLTVGLFLSILFLTVVRILVAGGGMSLGVGRGEAARWRAGRAPVLIFAIIGAISAQGIVVMALDGPLARSVAEYRKALLEVRRQGREAAFDAAESAFTEEAKQLAREEKPSEFRTKMATKRHQEELHALDRRRADLGEARRLGERDLGLYEAHLQEREFEGRRIAEAWRTASLVSLVVLCIVTGIIVSPAVLRVVFRSALASYYARRWEADRRIVLADYEHSVHAAHTAMGQYLRAINDAAVNPQHPPGPFKDPAFRTAQRAGHGLLDGVVVDTRHRQGTQGTQGKG